MVTLLCQNLKTAKKCCHLRLSFHRFLDVVFVLLFLTATLLFKSPSSTGAFLFICLFKNGKTFVDTFTLFNQNKTKTIAVPLDKGFNKIEILAIDEGSMRPNTGAFSMFDDEKKEVFSDLWHLAKGAKVIAHIIRE